MDIISNTIHSVTNGLANGVHSLGTVLSHDLGTAMVWTIVDNVNQSFLNPAINSLTGSMGFIGGYAAQTANNVVALVKLKIREGH